MTNCGDTSFLRSLAGWLDTFALPNFAAAAASRRECRHMWRGEGSVLDPVHFDTVVAPLNTAPIRLSS
jgi:hypothetical protein